MPHFNSVAQSSGQPIDADGIPHPAVNGTILTDGFFAQDQIAIALITRDMNLLSAPANDFSVVERIVGIPPVKSGTLPSLKVDF